MKVLKKIQKIVFLVIYYAVASKLPNYSFPGGRFYNWLRVVSLKNIIKIGADCRIMRDIYIGNGNNVEIGHHCRINEKVRLNNVRIGNHVMIARESIFLGKMHEFGDISVPMEQQGSKETSPIVIEDDVWIGLRVLVMPGLIIRKGSIIAAGAVLTKETQTNGVYAGVPANKIRKRTQ